MTSGHIIAYNCILLYVATGGRWSVAFACLTILIIASHEKRKAYSQNQLSTRISRAVPPRNEIDFTDTKPSIAQNKYGITRRPRTRTKGSPKRIKATKPVTNGDEPVLTKSSVNLLESQIYIFYSTLTGTTGRTAKTLCQKLVGLGKLKREPKLLSMDDDVDDLEEYFLNTPKHEDPSVKNLYLIVLPSYESDSPIDFFIEHLKETSQDFRVNKYPLLSLVGYSVLGLGDSESWGGDRFCYQAKLVDKWMSKMGGRRLHPLGNVCVKYDGIEKASTWIDSLCSFLGDEAEFFIDPNEVEDSDEEQEETSQSNQDVVDVEDMGEIIRKLGTKALSDSSETKEMVAKGSPTYNALTKQGYTIVGSHSGVKICRWTKSALRGRGSCYKFSFYGIRSHLCMETTPSLACSNKCVFCWRHGTNPVAKLNWRWVLDPPEKVFEGALQGHYQKIKQMRGIPGIQMDRFEEAFKVKHCALSLVGEPIFYPHINELVGLLHGQHISSFLVCNAQHPEQLESLSKVTQLYVSIDAPTKTDLKKVDRPLNRDYWERLMSCLDILRTKQSHQRTVFRLTLVKGFNMNDASGYADMVARARPSQIEVKGATFCGSSSSNGNPLTMQNIPFYEECKQFVLRLTGDLKSMGLDYEVAAEHAHSCCILIAHKKFFIADKWYTHINYPKFFELLESGTQFNDLDYIEETPLWAYWGSQEAGFNPSDVKFDRKAEKAKKSAQLDAAKNLVQQFNAPKNEIIV